MKKHMTALVLVVGLGLLVASPAAVAEPGSIFEKFKALAGEWEGPGSDGKMVKVKYEIFSNGSAVVETLTEPEPEEHTMVTVYHMDGDDVRMLGLAGLHQGDGVAERWNNGDECVHVLANANVHLARSGGLYDHHVSVGGGGANNGGKGDGKRLGRASGREAADEHTLVGVGVAHPNPVSQEGTVRPFGGRVDGQYDDAQALIPQQW